jgi:hypothetical protein
VSGIIAIDVDIYGRYARFSAVADWVEKLAVDGRSLSEADLADYIADNDWRFRDMWVVGTNAVDEETLDDGEQQVTVSRKNARSVFTVLEERFDTLGVGYPFRFVGKRLEVEDSTAFRSSAYAVLWGITLAQSYRLLGSPDPTRVFEALVATCVRSDRLATVDFGDLRRQRTSFPEALIDAGKLLSLPTDPNAAVRSQSAQDEQADMLGHLSWGDMRAGLWSFVGQATCANSEAWESKIVETPATAWRRWLGAGIKPTIFLAVPHHVESMHLRRLMEQSDRIVLDRLRLAKFKTGVTADEKVLVQAAVDAKCDRP